MRRLAVVALGLCMGSVGAAWANGRFPAAQYVVVGPGASRDVLVLRTTFGLVASTDTGRHWNWLCEDLFGYGGTAIWDPPLAIGARGPDGVPLLVGLPDGLARTLDRCAAVRVPEVGTSFTGDLTTDATGARVLWIASDNPGPNRVLASSDGGRSFTPLGAAPAGVLLETVETADADPQRVYVTGSTLDPVSPVWVFYRSDDGGRSLRALPLDLHGGVDAYLAGVDPTRADVVFVRSSLPAPDGGPAGTLLLRSEDGGAHFTVATRTTGPMMGFALSDDGRTLWVGGPDPADGLRRSDDGGGSFHPVAHAHVACLRWHAGSLYICGANTLDGYALGRSDDGGATITPLVRFADIGSPPACPAGTPGADVCATRWPQVRASLGLAPPTPDGGTLDAGTPPPAGNRGNGCGCAVGGGRPGAALAVLGVLVAWLPGKRRWRRWRGWRGWRSG